MDLIEVLRVSLAAGTKREAGRPGRGCCNKAGKLWSGSEGRAAMDMGSRGSILGVMKVKSGRFPDDCITGSQKTEAVDYPIYRGDRGTC